MRLCPIRAVDCTQQWPCHAKSILQQKWADKSFTTKVQIRPCWCLAWYAIWKWKTCKSLAHTHSLSPTPTNSSMCVRPHYFARAHALLNSHYGPLSWRKREEWEAMEFASSASIRQGVQTPWCSHSYTVTYLYVKGRGGRGLFWHDCGHTKYGKSHFRKSKKFYMKQAIHI